MVVVEHSYSYIYEYDQCNTWLDHESKVVMRFLFALLYFKGVIWSKFYQFNFSERARNVGNKGGIFCTNFVKNQKIVTIMVGTVTLKIKKYLWLIPEPDLDIDPWLKKVCIVLS